ncbi:MAG TPA: GNAT family N-acetyltransferase [Amycolatopsis sp.]|uniref:GNAT family N-acetyltransferase n=1 Tax=Amycolatopsis sp. TaxID=37632 RepID=UPI002B468584|nr:GNAT family N-acetyltransferase [Amycolatopsis sp.]HKS46035.1 GNAT family N-acetyltransferase [Amycolatopsis sp.]
MWTADILELHCADAWRPVSEDKIGDWRLRAAADPVVLSGGRPPDPRLEASPQTPSWDGTARRGFTGRANSVLAVGDPGMPVARALEKVCEFAHTHRIPAKVQVVEGSETEREIAAAGWKPDTGHAPGHVVSVLVGPLNEGVQSEGVLNGLGACPQTGSGRHTPDGTVSMLSEPSSGWWELTVGTSTPGPAQRHVLTTGEIGYGVAVVGRVTAGAVRAAVAGGILLVARLAVRPEFRRRGLATALMAACGSWAAERNAAACVLQVAVDNAPALELYRRLGFREHHRYRYWRPWKDRVL